MRYVPAHSTAAPTQGAPDTYFHMGFWQSSFLKEIHDWDNNPPNTPTITSPAGGENICSRYFTITWTEAVPTDPDSDCGDEVCYNIEYSTDGGTNWFVAVDNSGNDMLCIPEGTTSIVWDLGAIPDSNQAKVRICPVDCYGCEGACDEGNLFTICGGTCF